MTRSLVLLPILLFAACSVGSYGMSSDGTMTDSGGTDDRNLCQPRGTPGAAHNHALAGANPAGDRSGMACMQAGGCHGVAQPGSTVFAFAGSAFKELGGTTKNGGATVRIFPRSGMKSVAKTVTDTAGNFYIPATAGTFNQFPYEVDITVCGSTPSEIIPMIGTIGSPGEANCSSSNSCHQIPGTRAIYIP